MRHHHLVSSTTTIIVTVTFLLTLIVTLTAAAAATNHHHHHHHQDSNQDIISINCGSITPSPPAPGGKHWLADANPSFLTLKGSSTTRSSAAAAHAKLIPSVDQFPYTSARISRSKFSYSFHLSPGQKFIRLHFNPDSYDDFQKFDDLFTVEAGRFTLLSNFSASITADALSAVTLVKEFCVTVLENLLLDVVFTPASSSSSYAFINGIEIISLPAGLYYCLGGDVGVRLVGQRSVVYVDNATALEMIHRLSVKRDSVLPVDDFPGVFGMWKSKGLVNGREKDVDSGVSWKVPVDVGFRYLVRAHFCELGLKLNFSNFVLFIDHMVVNTRADVVEERDVNGILWYRNHMVEVKGRKEEGKRDILIYLHSEDGYADGHGVLEGFEIFKLSNHDNSLASLNPSPLAKDSPLHPIRSVLLVLGQRNAFITVVIAAICLVNIVVYMLRQHWEGNVTEEENEPSNRAKSLCRLFSFSEIQSATDDFFDAFIIGRGGFGKVYKGIVNKGQEIVAIKRLKANSKQGKREFWTEVEMLSELRHMNLVSLIGYCNEHREMILVYEYMSCGTLADHLYKLAEKGNNSLSLSWEQRLKICIGAARGLDYLHTGHGIIHRDVKASNILLDENFVAKVSDFGLAKIENADSTNLKGTFGYIDPDYFRTRKLTTKSDTYSFGVVLLEVLCGRRAVDPSQDEDKRSLTMWFRDNISKGDTDEIVAPSLREEISPDSLKTFLGVAEKCLHDEPKKRPTIAHVVINLEFALEQQENAKALVPSEKTSIADFFPHSNKIQQEHTKIMIPNETTNILDVLPCRDKTQEDNTRSLSPNEITGDIDVLPFTGRTILPVCGSQPKTVPSSLQNVTSILKVQTTSRMINTEPPYGKKDGRKSPFHKLSRLLPLNALWNSRKLSKKKNLVDISLSAPVAQKSSSKAFSRDDAVSGKLKSTVVEPSEDLPPTLLPSPDIRIFTFLELKAATNNFRNDTILGEGGFGRVYKGRLDDKSITRMGCRTIIAVKKLNPESLQGFKEWLSEVNFLGRLSHPNLVKLFGYCSENKEMLLVYEFMQKGSFDNHLFRRGSVRQPLAWDLRLKILIGAARGLAFLHGLDVKIIYRDFKTSNILLDESYNAKLSDFGLAKSGPRDDFSHVSTRVMGTYGYAAPEYVATGHLTDKSDVYSFGVVLVEILTGLRSLDLNRPSGQQNLVDWMKPRLQKLSKLKMAMDPNMEKGYPIRSALRVAQLALNCLGGDPKRRPTMQEVVETLEKIDLDTEKPRQPRVRFTEQLAK